MPLPKAPPADVRQTMHTAFKELESTITTDDSRAFPESTLSRVREEALDIENRLAARRSLRNMRRLMPLFTALEHYSKAIDVMCNGTPYMPWIWAPISLILRIASEYVEAFEKLVEGYSRIAESLQRFELLGHAFSGDTHFQQTLATFYADILQFHKHAYKFVRRNGWRLLFLTSWGRFQRRFDNILEDMKRHESLIDLEANAREISEATKMRQELRAWKEESLENIRAQDRQQSAKEFMTVMSWLQVNESDQITIFESTSGQGERHPGTCTWIHQNRQFRNWLQEGSLTPILWLSGNAGFGKSVIATQVINFIKIAKRTVFHHFCTYTSAASSNYDQILKSILQQVLREDVQWTSQVYNDFILKRKPATVPVLEQLLRTVLTSSFETLNSVKYVWIVLDGIDELCENMQMRLLSLVKHISGRVSSTGGVCCKVLISGRSSRAMAQVLGKKPKVSLSDQKQELTKGIEEYSRQRLALLGDRFEQLGIETHEMNGIGCAIAEKADGMFLYARLVLDYLSTNIFLDPTELRDSINHLPKELSEFYRKVLAQILAPLDTKSVEHIKCILGWLSFTKRPLKKHELLSAVSFSSGNPNVERPAPEYILSVCGSLLEERNDATITFIHVSVQEFLQKASSNLVIEKQTALQQHCLAAVTCLLSSFRLLNETCDSKYRSIVKGLYEFQVYASEYWTDYLLDEAGSRKGLDPDSRVYHLVTQFCSGLEGLLGPQENPDESSGLESELRLCRLQNFPLISKHVKRSLQARSLEMLENGFKQRDGNTLTPDHQRAASKDGASALLTCYQKAVIHILHARDIPGISANELESFRTRSRASAYTCRLRSCPRATLGFESGEARDEHEVGHARRFHCTSPSCQYPAFYSSQKLKRHMLEKHSMETPRKTIRQMKTSYQRESCGGLATLPTSDRRRRHMIDEIPVPTVYSDFLNEDGAVTKRKSDEDVSGSLSSWGPRDTVTDKLSPGQSQRSPLAPTAPFRNLTPRQLVKMHPDAREEYHAMRDQRSDQEQFKSILGDETAAFQFQSKPEVYMSGEIRTEVASYIPEILDEMDELTMQLNPWFCAYKDEARLRAYIRTRLRIEDQFHKSTSRLTLKESLTITLQELDHAKQLCAGIVRDLAYMQLPQLGGAAPDQEPQQGLEQQKLSETDKQRIQALAQNLMLQGSDDQKQRLMQSIGDRLPPGRLAQMRAEGQNPLLLLFQQEATKRFMAARRRQMEKQPVQDHPGTPQYNPKTTNNVRQVQSRSKAPGSQYPPNPILSVGADLWADNSSVIDLTGDDTDIEQVFEQRKAAFAQQEQARAEKRLASPLQHDLQDKSFSYSSPAPPAPTGPPPFDRTVDQSMNTGVALRSRSTMVAQDYQTSQAMIDKLDFDQLVKLGWLPASKRNELFSKYKRMGEQGLSSITEELEKLS